MFVKLALDENGAPKVTEGENPQPIFLDENEKEIPVDVPKMYQKIIDLGKESKGHREKAEELNQKLNLFSDIENLDEWYENARKALETVENLNDKDWMKAEKVESMKRQMKEAHEKELQEVRDSFTNNISERDQKLSKKEEQIRKLLISNKFASSPLFSGEKPVTTLTPDVAEAYFGRHFKVEEDEKTGELLVRAYYQSGEAVYSAKNPGELAGFEEGIQAIFDAYPGKNQYLRSTGGGSGAGGGSGSASEGDDDLTTLKRKYQEAIDQRRTQDAIVLKNKIFELQARRKSA